MLLTREKDEDLASDDTHGYSRRKSEDIRKRVRLIDESDADLFLSIHLNAIPSPKWRGAQTFYDGKYQENEAIAKFIQDELRKNLRNTDRKAKPISGVYLLKHAKKPGALVEVGFLSNPSEEELLASEEYQKKWQPPFTTGFCVIFPMNSKYRNKWILLRHLFSMDCWKCVILYTIKSLMEKRWLWIRCGKKM